MVRIPAVLGLTVSAVLFSPASVATGAGDPAPATCAGQVVTVDLNDPAAPDPYRSAADVVLGTPGDDRIVTGGGNDTVCGGAGDDRIVLRGEAPEDARQEAYGGPGDDYFNSSADDELLVGGSGSDTVDFHLSCRECGTEYPDPRVGVVVDLRLTGPQDTVGRGVDELSGIENLVGSGDDDVLLGNGERNRLVGFFGDDSVNGRRGADNLLGGDGTDRCIGGPGRDRLHRCER